MHWLLSVPETFSLREVIRRSGWLFIPSLHGKATSDHLYRVEHLRGAITVMLDIYEAPAGLVIHTDPHLSGSEIEEASQKVWRMLRLDENLQPFVRLAAREEHLKSVKRRGACHIRGATLFEDVTLAALVTWNAADRPDFGRVSRLVDRLGIPLPQNPTRHAFPEPARILNNSRQLHNLFGPELAARAHHIATDWEGTKAELSEIAQRPPNADDLAAYLAQRFRLTPEGISLLMLSLGRYDYIPTDDVARRRFARATQVKEAAPQDIRAFFERWQPWGGLAYWLWDWSAMPEPSGS